MPQTVVRVNAKGHQTPAWVNCPPRITMSEVRIYGSVEKARKAREIG